MPEQLVLDFFSRVWAPPHDLDAIDELMTDDYTITTAGTVITGRKNFKQWVGTFQKLLLDAKNESVDLFFNEAQDKVVSRWTSSGLNNGLFGSAPDHRFILFTGIAIWTIRNNRLSACWVERSAYELYQSLNTSTQENDFVK